MRLLDLFCGAGGCGVGYARAGFDVTGVDIEPQPRYPLPDVIQDDALLILDDAEFLASFDVIHASPPCQPYSAAMRHLAHPQRELIDIVRAKLQTIGRPWVIENVPGAPLHNPVRICGTGVGLPVYRHRLFESNRPITGTRCDHTRPALNPHNQAGRDAIYAEHGFGDPEPLWRRSMGVEWMTRYEAREAIPPAYTEHLGRQLIHQLATEEATR